MNNLNNNKNVMSKKSHNKDKNKKFNEIYLKAVKRANRLLEIENSNGFKAITKIKKNKKKYTRKNYKIIVE